MRQFARHRSNFNKGIQIPKVWNSRGRPAIISISKAITLSKSNSSGHTKNTEFFKDILEKEKQKNEEERLGSSMVIYNPEVSMQTARNYKTLVYISVCKNQKIDT